MQLKKSSFIPHVRICLMLFLAGLIVLICSGCTNLEDSPTLGTSPFEAGSGTEEVLFAYGFGLVSPVATDNMKYNGEAIQCEYFIENMGSGMQVGMLMFVNGVPQPYAVENADTTYMHIQEAPANTKTTVKFSFTPVCGKRGETVSVRFLSVLNPHIRPNKLQYVFGHTNAMTTFFPRYIEMNQDAPTQIPGYPYLDTQRDMTQEEIDQVIYVDRKGNLINKLQGFHLIVRDTTDVDQAYLTVENNAFYFDLQGYGGAPTQYVLVPFINQVPVLSNGFPCVMTIEEGRKIYEGKIYFDLTVLDQQVYNIEEFNTFYLLAVPIDGSSLLEPVISSSYVFSGGQV